MHLRDFLIRQYGKQGWTVHADFFDGKTSIPGGWTGIYPDILAVRGSRRVAVCIEAESGLRGEHAPVKWKSILRNPGVSLQIVVRDKAAGALVTEIAQRNGIELECRIMKRSERRRKKGAGLGSVFRSRMNLFILMITIVIVFIISFLFLPAMRKKVELQSNYYRPFDRERQVETLKKELKDLQKK
jgi:hypothetical protein